MLGWLRAARRFVTSKRGAFITAVVLIQALLPLSYYAGRRDPNDERFAWRMFSPKRQLKCAIAFTRNDQPVALAAEFHEAWIELAERGRRVVLEQMAARLCAEQPGSDVRLAGQCVEVDGRRERLGGYNMCKVPQL